MLFRSVEIFFASTPHFARPGPSPVPAYELPELAAASSSGLLATTVAIFSCIASENLSLDHLSLAKYFIPFAAAYVARASFLASGCSASGFLNEAACASAAVKLSIARGLFLLEKFTAGIAPHSRVVSFSHRCAVLPSGCQFPPSSTVPFPLVF